MSYRTYRPTHPAILSIGMACAAVLLWHGAATAASASVSIQNFAFMPAAVTITAGDTVTWTNDQSSVMHTVTADDGSFDSGPLSTGQRFSMTFPRAGMVAYHCSIHPNIPTMHGTVTVGVAAAATTTATSTVRPTATVGAAPSPAQPSATAAAVTAPTRSPSPPPAVVTRAPSAAAVAAVSQRPPVRQGAAMPAPAPRATLPNTGTGGRAHDRGIPLAPLGIGASALALVCLGLVHLRRCR